MPTEYWPATEAERLGRDLIRKHHDHLSEVRVDYVFRDKASKSNGKTVFGKARKISGLQAYLAVPEEERRRDTFIEDFFVVELAADVWACLTDEQKVALVDHELSHCGIDVDEKSSEETLATRPHDLEEFRAIVERHGLWQPDLELFAKTLAARELEEHGQTTIDDALADA